MANVDTISDGLLVYPRPGEDIFTRVMDLQTRKRGLTEQEAGMSAFELIRCAANAALMGDGVALESIKKELEKLETSDENEIIDLSLLQ